MFGSIGFPELLLIFLVVLLVFGPKKLPDFARSLGKFVREFRSTIEDAKSTIEREINQADIRPELRKIEEDIHTNPYKEIQADITPSPPADEEKRSGEEAEPLPGTEPSGNEEEKR